MGLVVAGVRWRAAVAAQALAAAAAAKSPSTTTTTTTTTTLTTGEGGPSPAVVYAVRFRPGEEIASALAKFCSERGLRAAGILTVVGSLAGAKLRLSLAQPGNPGTPLTCLGAHEIVSMVGTVGPDGMHVHASLGDADGHVFGGHLLSGMVHTTVEMVLCEATALEFRRVFDKETGFKELKVVSRS